MCQEIADEENILPALRSLANETLFYIINLGAMWFLLEGIFKNELIQSIHFQIWKAKNYND